MKNPVVLLLCFAAAATAHAQTELPEVTLVELIGPMILPSELRSQTFTLKAPAGGKASQTIQFNDPQVTLHDISSASTSSLKSGRCQTLVSINETLVKIMKWEPPVGVGIWQPPGSMPRIDLSPNDSVTIQVESVNTRKNDRGSCEAQFVVLATVPNS